MNQFNNAIKELLSARDEAFKKIRAIDDALKLLGFTPPEIPDKFSTEKSVDMDKFSAEAEQRMMFFFKGSPKGKYSLPEVRNAVCKDVPKSQLRQATLIINNRLVKLADHKKLLFGNRKTEAGEEKWYQLSPNHNKVVARTPGRPMGSSPRKRAQ